MDRTLRWLVTATVVVALGETSAAAQTFETLGTRAAGLGGAFVAVADDASAIYWNPAGLASGAYFNLLLDWNSGTFEPDAGLSAGSQSAGAIALSTPVLGFAYYRLRETSVRPFLPPPGDLTPAGSLERSNLVTHHAGATFVQSVTDWLAVATTLKFVRGVAAADIVAPADRDDLLDQATDVIGRAENKFDADIGVMATYRGLKAGLSLRNVSEPEFDLPDGTGSLVLDRQTRAGVSLAARGGITIAADVDIERTSGPLGDVRNVAAGAEARLTNRLAVRGGVRFNTIGDQDWGHAPVGAIGGSIVPFGSFHVDGQVTLGSEAGGRGWGVGGRLLF